LGFLFALARDWLNKFKNKYDFVPVIGFGNSQCRLCAWSSVRVLLPK
jgi:hypothetical protein